MTTPYIQALERKADNIRDAIEQECTEETMKLINELLEAERELTLLENQ